ncbi:MAG: hypothetical protein WAW86_06970 [Gammaproteobacteria bacterium]
MSSSRETTPTLFKRRPNVMAPQAVFDSLLKQYPDMFRPAEQLLLRHVIEMLDTEGAYEKIDLISEIIELSKALLTNRPSDPFSTFKNELYQSMYTTYIRLLNTNMTTFKPSS